MNKCKSTGGQIVLGLGITYNIMTVGWTLKLDSGSGAGQSVEGPGQRGGGGPGSASGRTLWNLSLPSTC